MDARPPPSLAGPAGASARTGSSSSLPIGGSGKATRGSVAAGFGKSGKRKGSAMFSVPTASAPLPESILNQISAPRDGGPGPPAPGADRQLVFYCWLHTSFETAESMELEGKDLDGGNGIKPLVKKLKQRGVAMDIVFGAARDSPGSARLQQSKGNSPPGAAEPPAGQSAAPPARSAALERAQIANANSGRSLNVSAKAGMSLRETSESSMDDGSVAGPAEPDSP